MPRSSCSNKCEVATMSFKQIKILSIITFALIAVGLYLIFGYAPVESTQGAVQKIFYYHVSSAFAMYLGFVASGFCAFMYLIKGREAWDQRSQSYASVGLLFCTMVLLSGPIWARPIWGVWWTWDPRLTTTLMLWLIFATIQLVRHYFGNEARGRKMASLLTLMGLLDIPLIIFAVKLWRGVHPSVLGQENSMPAEMRVTLIANNVALLLLAVLFAELRYKALIHEGSRAYE